MSAAPPVHNTTRTMVRCTARAECISIVQCRSVASAAPWTEAGREGARRLRQMNESWEGDRGRWASLRPSPAPCDPLILPVQLDPGVSHLSQLIPLSPGETRESPLIPLDPGGSRQEEERSRLRCPRGGGRTCVERRSATVGTAVSGGCRRSRRIPLVPLNPGESHLFQLIPLSSGESRASQESHLIPLDPGGSRQEEEKSRLRRPWGGGRTCVERWSATVDTIVEGGCCPSHGIPPVPLNRTQSRESHPIPGSPTCPT